MKKAKVFMHGQLAGLLEPIPDSSGWKFTYISGYRGAPVSLTMPVAGGSYVFPDFPPFFEGLLPEGPMLEGLLRRFKIDRSDLFSQLVAVGEDMVGAVTVYPVEHE